MVPAVMIRRITRNDSRDARTEGKLRFLNIGGEPGLDPQPGGSLEKILMAAVQNADSVDEACSLIASGSFDLVLYRLNGLGSVDPIELDRVCRETETALIRWNSQMEDRESEESMKGVFRDALIGIYRITPDGQFLMANPALIHMLGYDSFLELQDRNIETEPVFSDRTRQSFLEEIDKKGSVAGIESEWLGKDGSTFYVQETSRAVKGADGTTRYYEGTVQDVTKKRLVEDALRVRKEKFQALVETSGDFIWELDSRARYTYVSPQVEDILGYGQQEMIGRTPTDTVLEEDVAAMISFLEKVLNKQLFQDIVSRHLRKDGKVIYLETNAIPILGHYGELMGYRGIGRNVTQRVIGERALQAANNNLNLLNSITRHDVSNQLTIINGYLDLLGTLVQGEKGPAYLAKAKKATLSIRRQIEFSKDYQDMGTREARFQSVRDVVQNAMTGLDLGHISISVQLEGLEVFADPMLEKVFRNLLDNTTRHGGTVSSIAIGWHRDGKEAVISYQDDGVGISEADRSLLFIKGHGKNTGLGLFLSKAILAITNMSITNMPADKGARFDLIVPPEMFRVNTA